jgi:1,4-dihydroxy-2-naphthoate polyprenyltransferase
MLKIKYWIDAMRLRTLPLSVSGIIVGSGMAALLDKWDTLIFLFAILTTISFQVLSNFSNDLGDSQKGSDNNNRIGPKRTVQAGLISGKEMQIGIIICSILALLFAGSLIYISAKNLSEELIYFYVGLALSCVLSAITYTIGKRAYGYHGFGDLMVFLFFGLVSTLGVFSLYGDGFQWLVLLPAITVGLWSTAVLNLNNLRDHENDKLSKKNTLVVSMGFEKAKYYHGFLIILGLSFWFVSVLLISALTYNILLFVALIPSISLIFHLKRVFQTSEPKDLDPELKKVALITFFSSVIFALVINLIKPN